jgi:hypothetical protein
MNLNRLPFRYILIFAQYHCRKLIWFDKAGAGAAWCGHQSNRYAPNWLSGRLRASRRVNRCGWPATGGTSLSGTPTGKFRRLGLLTLLEWQPSAASRREVMKSLSQPKKILIGTLANPWLRKHRKRLPLTIAPVQCGRSLIELIRASWLICRGE